MSRGVQGGSVLCLCPGSLFFMLPTQKKRDSEDGCRCSRFPAWWGEMSCKCFVPSHLILRCGSGTSGSAAGQERAAEPHCHQGGGSACVTPAHGDIPVAGEGEQLRPG